MICGLEMLLNESSYIFHGECTTLRIDSFDIMDEKDVLNLMHLVCGFYHLHNISYFSCRRNEPKHSCPTFLTTCSQEWQAYYKTHRVYLIDPAVFISFNRLIPTDWFDLDRNCPILQEYFSLVERFNIGKFGLNIPVFGQGDEKSVIALTANGFRSDWYTLKKKYLRDLIIIAQLIHNVIIRLNSKKDECQEPLLTRREKQCLYWASRGKTVQETALILGISHNTVRAYIESARRALDCYTIAQAVTKAIHFNLLLSETEV